MASQAEALQQVVSFFRLNGAEGAQGRSVPSPRTAVALSARAPLARPAGGNGAGALRGVVLPVAALDAAAHDQDFKRF